MQISAQPVSSRPTSRGEQGYALLIVMTFMGIMLVLFAAMMYDTISNANMTKRNNQYQASQYAAEAATEKILAQMTHDFEFGAFTNTGSYYASTFVPDQTVDESDWPIKYTFSDTNNSSTNQISANIGPESTYTVPLTSQYQGLRGYEQTVTLTATATPVNGVAVPAQVTETIEFAFIPLFQFAIFYNMNLEIAAAQTLGIVGPVYSNGGIWSGSTTITFENQVSAVGLATNETDDPFCAGYTGSGSSTYSMAGQPTSGNDTLTMPVGTSNNPATVEAIINIPPSTYQLGTAPAFTTNGLVYFANAADLFITNAASGTNWGSLYPEGNPTIIYYQDVHEAPNYETWVTNDYYLFQNRVGSTIVNYQTNYVPNFLPTNNLSSFTWTGYPPGTNSLFFAGYSFLTNTIFYDWREGYNGGSGPPKTVQAVQMDLIKFNTWLSNSNVNGGAFYNSICSLPTHKSHAIDSAYIYNDVPLTSSTLPAVRMVHGGEMPSDDNPWGFTMATAMPIYVWGDYNATNSSGSSLSQNNTVYTEPAALMGDALTILSDNWSDTNSLAHHSGGPTASQTTIDAACLEGIVESNTNNAASDAHGYSGGVENFLRTLENWSSVSLWYNGSIVVMFPSQYATNCWQQTGGYYTAPSRHWAFDTNFQMDAGLPPLSPESQGVIRGTWSNQ